jgi:hypothetical protein
MRSKERKPETVIPKISQETLAEIVGTTRSRVSSHSDCQLRVKALRTSPWLISRSLRASGTSLAGGFWAGKQALGVHGDNAVVRMSNIINMLRFSGGRITGRRARVWHGGPDGGLII